MAGSGNYDAETADDKVPGLNRARPEEASVLRSYLAGSEQSKIIDIEVFCKI